MSSTACWTSDARTPSASPDPRSGLGPSRPSRRSLQQRRIGSTRVSHDPGPVQSDINRSATSLPQDLDVSFTMGLVGCQRSAEALGPPTQADTNDARRFPACK